MTTALRKPALPDAPTASAAFTYVYLASPAHSGSTLVSCLLGAHPSISTVGEFGATFSPRGRCSCGSPYLECVFWSEWKASAEREGLEFEIGKLGIDLVPRAADGFAEKLFYHLFPSRTIDALRDVVYLPGSRLRGRAKRAIDKSVRLARMRCQAEGTPVFLDTTKNAMQVRFLRAYAGVPLKLIAMVRDGRGMAHSHVKWYKWPFEKAVDAWIWSVRNLERAARYLPPRDVLWLRMEDLCREPEQHMKRLFEFCGVDPAAELDFSLSRRHIVGNAMRHKFDGAIRLDEKWREALTPEQLAWFDRRAGRLNRKYGYAE